MKTRASAKTKPSSANVERRRIADFLKNETFSGGLILIAATAGMLLANSPLSSAYEVSANFALDQRNCTLI